MRLVRLLMVSALGMFGLCGCGGFVKVNITVDVDVTWDVERAVVDRGADTVTG